MRTVKLSIAGVAALAGVIGCSQSVEVRLLESSGIYEPDAARGLVVFATSPSIDRHVGSEEVRPAEGLISICGLADQYYAHGPVEAAGDGRYRVVLPGMNQRIQRMADGQVIAGWPAELARRLGVCFRVEASEMMWLTLTSNEASLPR